MDVPETPLCHRTSSYELVWWILIRHYALLNYSYLLQLNNTSLCKVQDYRCEITKRKVESGEIKFLGLSDTLVWSNKPRAVYWLQSSLSNTSSCCGDGRPVGLGASWLMQQQLPPAPLACFAATTLGAPSLQLCISLHLPFPWSLRPLDGRLRSPFAPALTFNFLMLQIWYCFNKKVYLACTARAVLHDDNSSKCIICNAWAVHLLQHYESSPASAALLLPLFAWRLHLVSKARVFGPKAPLSILLACAPLLYT